MIIFLEALKNYKAIIYVNGENLKEEDFPTEQEYKDALAEILHLLEKITKLIEEIQDNIDKGHIHITVGQINNYYRNYHLDHDYIIQIKRIMRRIKNRYYQQASRDRKRINDEINS